jgi:site-specific DNA-methyltransferase (adenine-specific)
MARELNISSSAVLDIIKDRTWRTMPAQAPGLSKQDYSTPTEFIDAVKRKFGIRAFAYDLAASQENTKADLFFSEKEDSLQQDWSKLSGDLWLNCPYARIEPWAKKSYESSLARKTPVSPPRLFLLVPAAVGANWWSRWVHKKCRVYFLNGRISFDGKAPYPKDTALACYNMPVGYRVWRWKDAGKRV